MTHTIPIVLEVIKVVGLQAMNGDNVSMRKNIFLKDEERTSSLPITFPTTHLKAHYLSLSITVNDAKVKLTQRLDVYKMGHVFYALCSQRCIVHLVTVAYLMV